jgi:hypothetical protein
MSNSTLKGHGTIAEARAIVTEIVKHPRSDPPPPASGVERRDDEAIRAAVAAERDRIARLLGCCESFAEVKALLADLRGAS